VSLIGRLAAHYDDSLEVGFAWISRYGEQVMADHGELAALRFEVLGRMRVWRGDAELHLGPAQRRVVLAVLVLHANKPLGREQLIEAEWGPAAPGYAVNLVQKHVSALRRALDPARPARGAVAAFGVDRGRLSAGHPPGPFRGLRRRSRLDRVNCAVAESFAGCCRWWMSGRQVCLPGEVVECGLVGAAGGS